MLDSLWFEDLRRDVTIAARQMRGAPVFSAIAIATLALGIGANSAIFALADAVLLRPLPLPTPDRLVMLWERTDASDRGLVAPLNLVDWDERSRTFDAIAGYAPGVGGMVMSGADGVAETVSRQWVTARFFDALGVRPLVGRTFTSDDDRPGTRAVVLTEGFWRSRFGGDPARVGQLLRLDGEAYTVVGVVPDACQLLGRTSLWAVAANDRRPMLRRAHVLRAIGRMRPGVAIEAASGDLALVADALSTAFAETNAGRGVALEPLQRALAGGDLRRTSLLLLGVVGVVVVICCVNVASLLLTRASARASELALRAALGAGRPRVVRQLLTESLVLSAAGGVVGAAVGAAMLAAAPAVLPPDLLPPSVTVAFDARVAAFCAVTTVLVGLLFGVAPALQASGIAPAHALASDSRSATNRGGRLRRVLVAGEIAIAVVLLVVGGLLLRTLAAVETVDRGYGATNVLTMMVDPLGARYPTPQSLLQFFEAIDRELHSLPGVRGSAWATTVPLGASDAGPSVVAIVGDPPSAQSAEPTADHQIVSPSYFATLDVPIVEGRAFTDRDTQDRPQVCIVSEAFARQFFLGRSPLGKRVSLRPPDAPPGSAAVREVVGVARQVKGRPDERAAFAQVYVPLAQEAVDDIYLLVRSATGDAAGLTNAVRAAIARVDTEQLVSIRDIQTLDGIAAEATSRHRFRAAVVGTFAGLALLLAMIGVFGLLWSFVQLRARELAVRRAIGASTGAVLRLVVSGASGIVVLGAVIGLALSAATARLLATVLFGVPPYDPATFVVAAATLALAALASAAGPAWRAVRIEPAAVLRGD